MIARWEQGGSAPSLETLLELVGVCGFDLPLELAPRDNASLTRLGKNVLRSPERRVEQLLCARIKTSAKGGGTPPFDPYPILAALERHRVAYVLVGGFARVIHGADEVTDELDFTPSRRANNLKRLEFALRDLLPSHADSSPLPVGTSNSSR